MLKKKSRLLSFLIVILLILIIGVCALLLRSPMVRETGIYKFFSNLLPKGEVKMSSEVLKPDIKGNADFGFYGDTILIAQNHGVFAMNKKGEWLWDRKISLSKPIVRVAGEYAAVADLDGQTLLFFKNNTFMWQYDFKSGIINMNLSGNGIVTVVHRESGYKAVVSVMNAEGDVNGRGTIRFSRKISDSYVLSAVSSPDGKQVFVDAFNTGGGQVKSVFSFLSMENGESFYSSVVNEDMYPLAYYLDNGNVFTVNSDKILKNKVESTSSTNNDESRVIWSKATDKKQVLAADIFNGKYLVAAMGTGNNNIFSTSGNSEIHIFDGSGSRKASFSVPGTVVYITSGREMISVCTDTEAYFYTVDGKLLYKYNTISNIKKVYFCEDRGAVIFTQKDIHILSEEVKKND